MSDKKAKIITGEEVKKKEVRVLGTEDINKKEQSLVEDVKDENEKQITIEEIKKGYIEHAYNFQKEFPKWFTITRFCKKLGIGENDAKIMMAQFMSMDLIVSKNSLDDKFRTKFKFDINKTELKKQIESEIKSYKTKISVLETKLKTLL